MRRKYRTATRRRYARKAVSASSATNQPGRERSRSGLAQRIAIIADGNRRWARARRLPAIAGHNAGVDTAWARAHDAIDLGVQELTMFCFSTENWRRPTAEVDALMRLAAKRIASDAPALDRRGVRMRFIGRLDALPPRLVQLMRWAEHLTASNSAITVFLAFNYGGRAELLDAARGFSGGGERELRALLYAPDMHDPDVIIRTGGDKRLSNFLLWQSAEADLVFRDELWPAFGREAFEAAIAEGSARRMAQARVKGHPATERGSRHHEARQPAVPPLRRRETRV
jgi:undecaprenyl diphosphate synthase